MTRFALAIECLTGYFVATDPADRERAEWPPHPARVFMALAAGWFEAGEEPASGGALRWLESLDAPELLLPLGSGRARRVVEHYVPVNDSAGPAAGALQSAPTLNRSRQPRTFPRCHVGVTRGDDDRAVRLVYKADTEALATHRDALVALCRGTTRIGHSSSLVALRLEEAPIAPTGAETLAPGVGRGRLRTPARGLLDELKDAFGAATTGRFHEAFAAVESAKKKKDKDAAKARFEEVTGRPWKKTLTPSPPRRPIVSLFTAYPTTPADRRTKPPISPTVRGSTPFGRDLLVFRFADGSPTLGLASAAAVCAGVRATLMSLVPGVLPAWVSGHAPDGAPDRGPGGHVAVLPLAFAGANRHADGRLLGVALALPRDVDEKERARVLGPTLFDAREMRARTWDLRLGKLGAFRLERTDLNESRESLQPETWGAGASNPQRHWASATPVVLDRFPRAKQGRDPVAWHAEVEGIVANACVRIGLCASASEVTVDTGTTSWLRGSPRATQKRRRGRGLPAGDGGAAQGALGDGFPPFPAKGGNGPRPQVHCRLSFQHAVDGPVLVGAGRFGGYGLFRPVPDPASTQERAAR